MVAYLMAAMVLGVGTVVLVLTGGFISATITFILAVSFWKLAVNESRERQIERGYEGGGYISVNREEALKKNWQLIQRLKRYSNKKEPFKEGDKVVVYTVEGRLVGWIGCINRAGNFRIDFKRSIRGSDGELFSGIMVHPKQCRRLKSKS